jgi:hypothetical protein
MPHQEQQKKRETEQFYGTEITLLLQNIQRNIVLGGDFNCVLEPSDTTGHYMPKKALETLTLRLLMLYIYIYIYIYMVRLFLMFLDHTQRRSTVGKTPLDE